MGHLRPLDPASGGAEPRDMSAGLGLRLPLRSGGAIGVFLRCSHAKSELKVGSHYVANCFLSDHKPRSHVNFRKVGFSLHKRERTKQARRVLSNEPRSIDRLGRLDELCLPLSGRLTNA